MTAAQYRQALLTLGLTYETAAVWLGIGRSTSHRYTQQGCEGPVARCLEVALGVMGVERLCVEAAYASADDVWTAVNACPDGEYVRHSDLTAAIGLPERG